MLLNSISILNYRSLSSVELDLSPKINCFIGCNGVGKTNLLDAVYYLSFCKSAIATADTQHIKHEEQFFMIQGSYVSDLGVNDEFSCGLKRGDKKQFKRNKKNYDKLSEHIGLVPLVMISPADYNLISGGSEERRRFMDVVISQYDKEYLHALIRYNRALAQRNVMLRGDRELDPEMMELVEQMMAAEAIKTPFAVINADDFYGQNAYEVIGNYLSRLGDSTGSYCMVGYEVNKTLSENGTVSRGVCTVDENRFLTSMVERTKIERNAEGVIVFHDLGDDVALEENTPVSMNLFGFTPDYFVHSVDAFKEFLAAESTKTNLKAEFFIPLMVNRLIGNGSAQLKVLSTTAQWFGVTYKEDKPQLMAKIESLIEAGVYPRNLWK